jgi:predicted protein tyrosine phosphatase
MINEVKIFNRFNMDMFAKTGGLNFPYHNRPWYLISIYSDDDLLLTDKNKEVFKEMGCRLALPLSFWDISDKQAVDISEGTDEQAKRLQKTMTLFSTEQAKLVIGFLTTCDQDDETDCVLVVHCDAGISRSGAVGTFAVDFLRLNYQEFTKGNPYLRPNYFVLRVLRNMAGMTPATVADLNVRDDKTLDADEEELKDKRKDGFIFLP